MMGIESFEIVIETNPRGNVYATIEYELANFSEDTYLRQLGIADDSAVRLLARYDNERHTTVVDERAPQWYRRMAAMHEVICCGGLHESLIRDLPPHTDPRRCREVEKFVVRLAGFHRYEYIIYRRQVFTFMLQNHLNPNISMLRYTLDMLENARA